MQPTNSKSKSDTVYLNKFFNEERVNSNGEIFKPVSYSFAKNHAATQDFIEALSVKRVKETGYGYLECRVTLKNDEIRDSLLKAGGEKIAILSREGFRIEEDQRKTEQSQHKEPTNDVEKPAIEKHNTQDSEKHSRFRQTNNNRYK